MRLLPESAMHDMLREGRAGPFFMSDPARVRAILGDAGRKDISLERVEMPLHLGGAATLDEAVEYSLQIGPAARAMADAPETLKPALEAALCEALAPFATAAGVLMDGAAFVVGARVSTGGACRHPFTRRAAARERVGGLRIQRDPKRIEKARNKTRIRRLPRRRAERAQRSRRYVER